MNSCSWINQQNEHVGPPPQFSQTAPQFNLGTADNSCQYGTSNTGVQLPQSAHFTFRSGVYCNRQMSNWQTSAVTHQAVPSQQPAGGKSLTNAPSGNPLLMATNGLPVASQQDFHPNSGFISSSSQSLPNMMRENTTFSQQDMSAFWNKQLTFQRKQPSMSHLRGLLQNENEDLIKPVSAYRTTASSFLHKQEVYTNTIPTSTIHYANTAHNQNPRLTRNMHGFNPSFPPPSYHEGVFQSFRNKSITTNSSSSKQKTPPQQYPINFNSTHNNSTGAAHRFLPKTNELPLNPAANMQEQMHSQQMITRIADDLRKSFPPRSDNYPSELISSPYKGNQLINKVKMMESNQKMQSVTLTVTDRHNSNSFQSQALELNSGLHLSKTTHSVMSKRQQSVNASQQNLVTNVFHVTTTSEGSGNESNATSGLFPKSDRVLKRDLDGSLSNASPLISLPESISLQKSKTDSSVANHLKVFEISEKLSHDGSIHSSPGRQGVRAVAVVQPLSQENYQVCSKHTSSNMTNQMAEHNTSNESLHDQKKSFLSPSVAKYKKRHLTEGPHFYPENPNEKTSTKSGFSHSAASSDSALASSSDLDGDQYSSQKQTGADDTGFKLTTAQRSVTSEVLVSQSGDEDKSENHNDPKATALDLSSIPTIPWTTVALTNLILEAEKAQLELSRHLTTPNISTKILSMFWHGNFETMLCKVKTSWYKCLITNAKDFCNKYVTSDSALLWQVKDSFEDRLKRYHVLEDSDVFSELPYKSSWLNVNEQLDEIDKEFGFPWSLKHRPYMLESHSQLDQIGTVNSIHAQIVNQVSDNVSSQTDLELVDSGEEKQVFSVEATSAQADSPNETESVDSSDECYEFEIQVLPPEEAKVIFEQIGSEMPQSIDTDSHSERVMNSSVEDEPLEILESETVCPVEQICCIPKLMEILGGPNKPLSECQCKNEQNLMDCTDKTVDKEEMAVEKRENMCVSTYDSKFHKEVENQVKGENTASQITTFSWPEISNKRSHTITLDKNDHKTHFNSDKEPKNISQITVNSSPSSLIIISDNEDNASSSDIEIQSDTEVDFVQGQVKSTGSMLSYTSLTGDKENENPVGSESEVASQMSDHEGSCEKIQLNSTDMEESLLETEEQTQVGATAALQTTLRVSGKHRTVERKWKRKSFHNRVVPFHEKSIKCKPAVNVNFQPLTCRKTSGDATNGKPLASKTRAVQLVLFGSAPQDKCDLIDSRGRPSLSLGEVSDVPRPPKVLSVNVSPLKRKSNETVPTEESSVKRWIHEKWKSSFPQAKIRRRSKRKVKKRTFASLSGKSVWKAETVGPNNTQKLPVSSEMKICNRETKLCLSLKRRRYLLGPKGGEEKIKKYKVTFKQPAELKQGNAENESLAVPSYPGNNVLKFSVLPSTFDFKDGSNERTESNNPVTNKSDLAGGKDKSLNEATTKEKGTWYPYPEKKYCTPRSPAGPKTSSVFNTFRKKYMEMTQSSMNK